METYSGRLTQARGDAGVLSTAMSPQDAATLLLRALMSHAELAAPLEPIPADLPTLQRRNNSRLSLADGPIQTFVANQLGTLDLTAYLLVADRPKLRDRVLEITREGARARAGATNVLEQSLSAERTVLELWRLRLGLDPKLEKPEEEEEEAS
jgi:hypothetical protein